MYEFYVVGSLSNIPIIRAFSSRFRHWLVEHQLIADVNDQWTAHGSVVDAEFWNYAVCSRNWSYEQALNSDICKDVFELDKKFIDRSSCVIMIQPCGKSAALELGYAAGTGKRTIIIKCEPIERIEVMELFADYVFNSMDLFFESFQFTSVYTFLMKSSERSRNDLGLIENIIMLKKQLKAIEVQLGESTSTSSCSSPQSSNSNFELSEIEDSDNVDRKNKMLNKSFSRQRGGGSHSNAQ
jgi:hypothetical protein